MGIQPSMSCLQRSLPAGALSPRLLLADRDRDSCDRLSDFLRGEGFIAGVTHDGNEALARLASEHFDLLVLDLMMPGKDGLSVLRELRRSQTTPVLMRTNRSEDVDCIVALELGADDYLAKSCNPRVLSARIRALLRRTEHPRGASLAQTLTVGDVVMQIDRRSVDRGGESLQLTRNEFRVLEVLLRDAGHVVPRTELTQRALGRELGRFDRSLDMHMNKLRAKLGPQPDGAERITTVRATGYQYVVRAEATP